MAKDHRMGGKQQHGKSRERYFARRRATRGLPDRSRTANGQAKAGKSK